MGYNRNMPREAVFGPKALGGIGMTDLFVEQGRAKCIKLLEHIRNMDSIGRLMRIALDWTQLTAGVGFSVLEHPGRSTPLLSTRHLQM